MFSYDSPLMRTLNKITDFIILNLLTFVCCIPIITIGASLTAAHYTALKMRRDTDNYVFRNFFRSFKTNFLQSTGIWLLWLVFVGLSAFAMLLYGNSTFHSILKGIILAVLLLVGLATMWVWPVQSKFINPIRHTIRNAFMLSGKYIFRTLLMLVICLASGACWFLVGFKLFWIILFFGFSVPIYLCVMLYDKPFAQLEERVKESMKTEDDEFNEDEIIMHDESRYIEQEEEK